MYILLLLSILYVQYIAYRTDSNSTTYYYLPSTINSTITITITIIVNINSSYYH